MMTTYRQKIVIDWISLRLTLPSASNYWSVRNALESILNRSVWAKDVGAGPGRAACVFDVKIQDPRYVKCLGAELQKLWPGSTAEIVGMEVALDTYTSVSYPAASELDLAKQLFEQFKWMEYATAGRWHLYRAKGERTRYLSAGNGLTEREVIQMLAEQWQLTDWNKNKKNAPARFHLHVKTTDVGARPLPRKLWRARLEVTLQGDQLPWKDVDELASADFTDLQDWFRFCQKATNLTPALDVALQSRNLPADMQPGRRGRYRRPNSAAGARRHGTPRAYRPLSAANQRLNARIYDQLRRLHGPGDYSS
jgi:hypothetical protein